MPECMRCDGTGEARDYAESGSAIVAFPVECPNCRGTGQAPLIVGVALRTQDGVVVSLPKPSRHHDVIRVMGEQGYSREQIARSDQGFVTDGGDWVMRAPAKMIAQEAGQIIHDSSGGRRELFSEDVW